jgi:hypothetical protein
MVVAWIIDFYKALQVILIPSHQTIRKLLPVLALERGSFTPQILTEKLLYSRHCARGWGHSSKLT